MCTAATYLTKDFYFGRTLDYEFSYGEEIAVTPRNYPFHFRHTENLEKHYAIIGMAHMAGDYPLYYDAVNEKGVGMAGLNFVGNAYYHKEESGKKNVASFEFIPWVLAQCATLDEVRELIADLNIVDTPFSENLPSGMLHWIISDKSGSITVESMKDGLHIHENPVGVLTNNPPFEQQMFMLNNYMGLSPKQPENHFADKLDLNMYSRGMGALGLPGDLSSASRFARVAFTKMNAVSDDSEEESVFLNVRPGITGYNQAYYRNSANAQEKINNDVYYAKNISFALDVKIIFKTIKTVLFRENVNVTRE